MNISVSLFLAPSNPRNVKTSILSPTEVKVSWAKPSYEGSGQGIVGYDIYYNTSLEAGRKQVPIQSPDDLSKVVIGLRPATVYQFEVAARTDDGSGPLSFPEFVTTWEGGKLITLCVRVYSTPDKYWDPRWRLYLKLTEILRVEGLMHV